MATKHIQIYKINRNYTGCKVWHGERLSRGLVGTSTLTLDKGLARRKRYEVIAKWLTERCGLQAPDYQGNER